MRLGDRKVGYFLTGCLLIKVMDLLKLILKYRHLLKANEKSSPYN